MDASEGLLEPSDGILTMMNRLEERRRRIRKNLHRVEGEIEELLPLFKATRVGSKYMPLGEYLEHRAIIYNYWCEWKLRVPQGGHCHYRLRIDGLCIDEVAGPGLPPFMIENEVDYPKASFKKIRAEVSLCPHDACVLKHCLVEPFSHK